MTTDKNGKELKVGDFIILECEVIEIDGRYVDVKAPNEFGHYQVSSSAVVSGRAWSEAQVRQALDSAFRELMDGPDRFGLIDHVIKALNTPRP